MPTTSERTVNAISKVADIKPEDIEPDHQLLALGLDSMDKFEMAMELEDDFGITLEDEDITACKTVGDVVALVERSLPVVRA